MRIQTTEQNIALKQLKGTPRSMAIQLHPIRQQIFFSNMYTVKMSLIVTSNVHRYTFIKSAEFVMVNEVKGIPVEMAQLTLSFPHSCSL